MLTIRTFINRHAVLTYFILTFVISWGLILLVIGGPGRIPGTLEETDALLPIVVLAMVAGPSIAGLLMIGLTHGRQGYRRLVSHLLTWRVRIGWYAMALLFAPMVALATLLVLSLVSSEFIPSIYTAEDKTSLVLFGIIAGLSAGIFEEIGWTGFATPELRKRHSMLATGLIVGFLWGAWHYLVAFWGGGDDSGAFVIPLFLAQMIFYVAVLPAFRVLMVWVYDHTQSLLVAMLMHASLTGGVLFLFMPEGISDPALIIWYLAMAVVFWLAAAVVAVTNRRQTAMSSVG